MGRPQSRVSRRAVSQIGDGHIGQTMQSRGSTDRLVIGMAASSTVLGASAREEDTLLNQASACCAELCCDIDAGELFGLVPQQFYGFSITVECSNIHI